LLAPRGLKRALEAREQRLPLKQIRPSGWRHAHAAYRQFEGPQDRRTQTPSARRPGVILSGVQSIVTVTVRTSDSERPPAEIADYEADDVDRLGASLAALACLCCEPEAEKTGLGDGLGEVPAGEVVAMPIRSAMSPGAFEPEMIATMSEALDAACQLHANGQHEVVREVIARRIVIAARLGERDPVRLQAAALAGRQIA
jgi:hypothetical protein